MYNWLTSSTLLCLGWMSQNHTMSWAWDWNWDWGLGLGQEIGDWGLGFRL